VSEAVVVSLRSVNEARGEVGLRLGDDVLPMSPSFETVARIEAKLGSVLSLARRCGQPSNMLTVRELAAVAGEAIRRWGEEHNDAMLSRYQDEKLAKLIAEDDLVACTDEVGRLLMNMCQRKKRPAAASSSTESTS
jgi:hypothetical protein